MNIDERIKTQLEANAKEIDLALGDTGGLFALAAIPFRGGLRRWMVFAFVLITVMTGFMVWSGYRFFVAGNADERIFWGVWFLATLMAQAALKLWTWMEINRNSLLREVKRLEIAVAKLGSQIGGV